MLIKFSINKESLAIVPFSFGDRDVAGGFKQMTTPCSTVVEKNCISLQRNPGYVCGVNFLITFLFLMLVKKKLQYTS